MEFTRHPSARSNADISKKNILFGIELALVAEGTLDLVGRILHKAAGFKTGK